MKNILITGCSGFIGTELVRKLSKKYFVIGIDKNSFSNLETLKLKNFRFIKGYIENKSILNSIKCNIDYIFHLAGQSSGEKSFYDPVDDLKKNLLNTVLICELGLKKGCKKLIFASSMSVYGDCKNKKANEKNICKPKSFYGLSKLTSEYYIKKYSSKGLNYTIVRLFNVYGETQKLNNFNQGMLRIYLSHIKKNNNLVVKGSTRRFRDFVHIDDVIKILEKTILIKNTTNQVFNIGSGRKVYVSEIIKMLKKNIKRKFKIKHESGTPDDQKGIFANNNKIKKYLNYKKFKKYEDNIVRVIKSSKL